MVATRKILAIIGTDGTGKTTLIDKFREQFGHECSDFYMGLKIFYFPWTHFFLSSNKYLYKLFVYFFFPLDLLFKKFQVLMCRKRLIVIDRLPTYPFTKKGFKSFLYSAVTPRFDGIIWLHGDPGIIHQRKQERSIEGLIQDQKKIKSSIKNMNAKVKLEVDISSLTPSEVLTKVVDKLKL